MRKINDTNTTFCSMAKHSLLIISPSDRKRDQVKDFGLSFRHGSLAATGK